MVSIIVVNYNGADVILNCLASIYRHLSEIAFEVIVVDNASKDGSPELISQWFPKVTLLLQPDNLGFGAANNIGAERAQGEVLFLLNSDTILTTDVLPTLMSRLIQSPKIGIVGPQLLNSDGSFQLSVSKDIGIWGEFQTVRQVHKYRRPEARAALAKKYSHDQPVDIVVGAAMFMRRSLFMQVGGFDEAFFMYFEESDLCKRVRKLGYTIFYTPAASVIHLGGYSVAKVAGSMAKEYRRSQRYYYQKHRPRWEQLMLCGYLRIKGWRCRLKA